MSDTPYKATEIANTYRPAGSIELSNPSELLRPPVEAMALAQDSILGGRRLLMTRHTGGAQEWLVDNVATGGVSQGKPDDSTWRETVWMRTEQQAGTSLSMRLIAVPSGATEYNAGGTWDLQGVGGETRVVFTWNTVDSNTATHTIQRSIIGEEDSDGAEQSGTGAQWAQLQHHVVTGIRPPDAPSDLAEARKYSEWSSLQLEVADRGGARIIQCSVSEHPGQHVSDHDETDVTITDSAAHWETKIPQDEAADGATNEENRYGIHRSMVVAEKQSARVGPMIAHWSAYDERAAEVTDTTPDYYATSSTTFVRLGPGTNTAWDVDEVGWHVMGTQRAPENLSTRITGASSVPVRIRVEAQFDATGSGVSVVRFATTSRGWVDVYIDRSVVGTTWTEVVMTGWLEASIASDDGYPKLQAFFKSHDGAVELRVRYWSVSYGEYPVGA